MCRLFCVHLEHRAVSLAGEPIPWSFGSAELSPPSVSPAPLAPAPIVAGELSTPTPPHVTVAGESLPDDVSDCARLQQHRQDHTFNRTRRAAVRAGIPLSTVLNPTGQPIDDAVSISSLIKVFQDRDIPIMMDVLKAKLPRQVNGRYQHTQSSRRLSDISLIRMLILLESTSLCIACLKRRNARISTMIVDIAFSVLLMTPMHICIFFLLMTYPSLIR